MMSRSASVTWACLVCSLAAAVVAFRSGPVGSSGPRGLWMVPASALDRIAIGAAGGETELRRVDSRWEFVRPFADLADPDRMRNLVPALCRLPILASLKAGQVNDSALGLAPSQAIRLELGQESRTDRIWIGRAGALDDTVYARIESPARGGDASGVHLVNSPLRPVLAAPADHLRERRLFSFPVDQIRSYAFRTANLDVEFTRDPGDPRWRLTRPVPCRANDDIAESILEELAGMRAQGFFEDRARTGGSETQADGLRVGLTVQPREGNAVQIVLEPKAARGSEGEVMLAHVDGRRSALEIRDDLIHRLPRSLEQLRYPYLAEFNRDAVARIVIRSRDDPAVELAHDGRGWSLVGTGVAQPAHDDRVKQLISALLAEPILQFRSNSLANLETFGLDRPFVRLALVTSSIDSQVYDAYQAALARARAAGLEPSSVPVPQVQVEEHAYAFGFGRDGLLNVHPAGTTFIYGLDPSFLSNALPTHPLKWRDLQLLSFSLFEVRSVSVALAGEPEVRLDYDYLRNEWAASSDGAPVSRAVDPRRAERLAVVLGNLRARDYLTSRADAYSALARPSAVVRVRTLSRPGEPETERVLRLAPAVSGAATHVEFYFGQFEREPDVFMLDAAAYDRIAAPVWKPDP